MSSALCASLMYMFLAPPPIYMHYSSLHENVVFFICARMGNASYFIFIMWNTISGLDAWYYFRLNVSCGVAVTVRSHQIEFQVIF